MSVSDQLLDLTIIRQLLLERVVAGQSVQLNKQLNDIAAALEKQLKGKELSEYQGRRLDKAIAELKAIVRINPPDLADLGTAEAQFFVDAMASVGIEAALPSAAAINDISRSALIQGATIGDWFSRLNENTRFDLERTIKNGVSLGLTNSQIAKTLIGTGDKGGEPIAKSRRDAMAITRTAVQTVAKDARLASLEANSDIIKEVQWVSTLDSRTSDICIVRSGKLWTYPDFKPVNHSIPWNGGPPAHWNCRSTFIPITKSFEELTGGKIKDTVEPSTRASMDGTVAGDLTFDQFLRGKPPEFADEMLGNGRAELWRSGKITLNQLLDQRGNPLTLAELRSRYGGRTPSARNAVDAVAPPPAAVVNRPAVNPLLNEATVTLVTRKQAQKELSQQFAIAAQNADYGIEEKIVFRGIKASDLGKSNLSTGFSDEAMSMILGIKPELDELADRFNIPKLRGFKTSKASIGSMGDGVMTLHPDYFSGWAANVGARAGASSVDSLTASITDLRRTLAGYGSSLEEINQQLAKVARNSQEFDDLWSKKAEIITAYNKLAGEVNANIKKLQMANRNAVKPSEWLPGNDPAQRPHGVEYYMDNGMDRARVVLYHEFAHHIHQTYGKSVSRLRDLPPLEKRLKQLWNNKTKAARDRQASKYSTTNEKEWFAENFALYMMGKRNLVDEDLIKLIEEMLNEQANR